MAAAGDESRPPDSSTTARRSSAKSLRLALPEEEIAREPGGALEDRERLLVRKRGGERHVAPVDPGREAGRRALEAELAQQEPGGKSGERVGPGTLRAVA